MAAFFVGLSCLLGWLLHLPANTILPANSALGFIFAGLGLYLSTDPAAATQTKPRQLASLTCAGIMATLGLAALVERLFGEYLGINDLLVRSGSALHNSRPDRIEALAALDFSLLGGILILRQWPSQIGQIVTGLAALVILGTSGLALLAYLFYPEALQHMPSQTLMGLPTALLFTLLAFWALPPSTQPNLKALNYGLTFLAVALAYKLHFSLGDWFGTILPTSGFFYAAILLSGLLAGVGPGLFALMLSASVNLWIYDPVGLFAINKPINHTALLLYIFNGLLINWVVHLYHRSHRQVMAFENGQAMHDLEVGYRDLFEGSLAAVFSVGTHGRFLTANNATLRLIGRTHKKLTDLLFVDLCVPDQQQEITQAFHKGLQGLSFRLETALIDNNGDRHELLICGTPIRENAKIVGVACIAHDLTERKQAEDDLYATHQRLKTLMDSLPVGVSFSEDTACHYVTGNPAVLAQFDVTQEDNLSPSANDAEALGRQLRFFMDGRPIDDFELPLQRAVAENREIPAMELEIELPSGRRWYASASAAPLHDNTGRVVGGVAVTVDITRHKQAEEKLRLSELRFRLLHESMRDAFVQVDMQGRIQECNDLFCQLIGYTQSEIQEMTYMELTPSHWHAMESDIINNQILPYGYSDVYEKEYRHKDGSIVPIELRCVLISDNAGRPESIWANIRDITERKRAEAIMRASEQRFRSVAENLSEGLMLFDPQGHLIYQNASCLQLHGYATAEAGRTMHESLPTLWEGWDELGQPLPFQLWPISRVLRGECFQNQVLHARRTDTGLSFDASYNGCPIYDESGKLALGFLMIRNIAEQRQAEAALRQSQQQLTLALEAGQLGFWDWDIASGRVQFGGHWASMLGYHLSEIEPHVQSWKKLIHPDEQTSIMAVLSDHLEGRTEIYECEHRMRHRDGSWRWILDRGQVVERDADGQPLRAVGTHTDVTARHESEVALHEADRRKDEFLATLAHELRNPLTPISNGLHILQMSGVDSTTIGRVLGMMERQVNQMVRLVDELMEISRITRGIIELRKEKVDLSEILQSAVETSRPLLDKAHHRLDINLPTEPLWLQADKVRLTQVFANLLNNAAKFTPEGGQIWLNAQRDGLHAVVTVRDNGVGIPVGMLHKVFELFTQIAQPAHSTQSGLGIGLTLVQNLVEQHGGSVKAKSNGPNMGCEFVVHLPVADEVSLLESLDHDRIRPVKLNPQRILVVDDNRDAADSLVLLLRQMDVDVIAVNDGFTALETLKTYRPSVVLLDIGMPNIDGYEVSRRIRQLPEGQEVTLIALTGWDQAKDRQQSEEAGFNYHLVKPLDLTAFEKLLAALPRTGTPL